MEVTDGKLFAAYMKTVRNRTLDVIGKVPPDHHNWRLSPDSMSTVDIVLHIASVEKALWGSELIHGRSGRIAEFARDSMTLEAALEYMAVVRKESTEFWRTLTPGRLDQEITTPTGDSMLLKRWLVLAAEHEIHHRSFVHASRKIWGLPSSPIYGLTFDQLRALSNQSIPGSE